MPPKKQLISCYFKPSSSDSQTKASPSKRPRLAHLSSPSTIENNSRKVLIGDEAVAIINSVKDDDFSRSLNFATHIMELDEMKRDNCSLEAEAKSSSQGKLTPLEAQVLALKGDHPGVVLAVEVGYKYYFFENDARIASSVLGSFTHTKHNLITSQVASHRIGVTIKRLVEAGYKVGVVLQSEAASLKAAGLSEGGKTGTFRRHLARVYTASTLIDDDIIGEGKAMAGEVGVGDENDVDSNNEEEIGEEIGEEVGTSNFVDNSSISNKPSEKWIACVLSTLCESDKVEISVVFAELKEARILHHCFIYDSDKSEELTAHLQHVTPCEVIYYSHPSANSYVVKSIKQFVSRNKGGVRIELLSPQLFESSNQNRPSGLVPQQLDWKIPEGTLETTAKCVGGLMNYLSNLGLSRALRGSGANGSLLKLQALYSSSGSCDLDASTLRDLEVFNRDGKSGKGTLFDFINRTVTPAGCRTLKSWLRQPLGTIESIQGRVAAVELLAGDISNNAPCLADLWSVISRFRHIDLDGACVQLASRRIGPTKLMKVVEGSLELSRAIPSDANIKTITSQSEVLGDVLRQPQVAHVICCCELLMSLIDVTVKEDKALALRKGIWTPPPQSMTCPSQLEVRDRMIASLSAPLVSLAKAYDSITNAETQLHKELDTLSRDYRRKLNYRHLRVGAMGALEYLVELPVNAKAPDGWAIVNSTNQFHRYRPPSVVSLHQVLLQAREKCCICASEVWENILRVIETELYTAWRSFSVLVGVVDALHSLGVIACLPGYCKPSYQTEDGYPHSSMRVVGGKHPTVDYQVQDRGDVSVANDVTLSQRGGPRNITVVTGPNMGGKSTYVRMVAVLALLGQVGSYLPCESAEMVLFDQIRTRMGADDDIASGMSTFLVELDHCSRILKSATPQSLVILDELGRGTSTHDGVAVAKATLLYLASHVKCATLFVTHYPEISSLASEDGQIVNIHMDYMLLGETTSESVPDVVFLYKAVSGKAATSHGLSVAQLAGLPPHLLSIALDHCRSNSISSDGGRGGGGDDDEVTPTNNNQSSASLEGGDVFLRALLRGISAEIETGNAEETEKLLAEIVQAQKAAFALRNS